MVFEIWHPENRIFSIRFSVLYRYRYTDRRFLAKTGEPRSQLLNEIERRPNPSFEAQTLNCVVGYVELRPDSHVGRSHVTSVLTKSLRENGNFSASRWVRKMFELLFCRSGLWVSFRLNSIDTRWPCGTRYEVTWFRYWKQSILS